MRPLIFVRPLTDAERARVEAGLRSPDAFALRRCQIVLARARGERASAIAYHLGCDDQTVREVIHHGAEVTLLRDPYRERHRGRFA